MLDAVSFLRDAESQDAPRLGRVAVYGGGNTAMDAARVARRLGASEAMIIYRRDRAHMPAHEFEAAEAEAEGVEIHWLRTIKSIDRTTFTVEVMEIGEDGRPRPTGQVETLEADALIMALGQASDTDFLKKVGGVAFQKDGTVVVDRNMMTGRRRRSRSPSGSRALRRWSPGSARAKRSTRRAGASPAATASSAMAATAPVRSMRSRSSGRACATATPMISAPAAPSASSSVPATRSR